MIPMMMMMMMQLAQPFPVAEGASREVYVEAPGPLGPLKGTMLEPRGGGKTVILMIPGSGLVDRDGNSPTGMKAATLRLLAEALANRGISTVRVDKRGMFASSSAVRDANSVSIEDYATDVRSWIGAIREKTGANCIWVLGHSEGGLVALKASQHRDGICGLILVSTPGKKIGEVLRHQIESNPANKPILDQALASLATLERGQHVDVSTLPPALGRLFHPSIQDFLIDEMKIDPSDSNKNYGGLELILHGANDLQIDMENAEILNKSNPKSRLIILKNANHVIKDVRFGDLKGNIGSYSDPSLPLSPGVAESIAEFIHNAS